MAGLVRSMVLDHWPIVQLSDVMLLRSSPQYCGVCCAEEFSPHPDATVAESLLQLTPAYAVLHNVDYNEAKQGQPAPGQVLKDLPDGGIQASDIQNCAVKCAVPTPCAWNTLLACGHELCAFCAETPGPWSDLKEYLDVLTQLSSKHFPSFTGLCVKTLFLCLCPGPAELAFTLSGAQPPLHATWLRGMEMQK